MGIDKELLDKIVCRESAIFKAVLAKFGKQRVSELNEPEVRGLLAMYDRVSRNYTSEIINTQKDKRMGIIREERNVHQIPKAAPATAIPQKAEAKPAARSESDLPVECAVKTNGEDKKILFYIRDNQVLNPAKVQVGTITPKNGTYGIFYTLSNDKSIILTKSRNGSWLAKQRNPNEKGYAVIGHVSTKLNEGGEKA